MEAVTKQYGSYDNFQQAFRAVLLGLQGSGFVVSSRGINSRLCADKSVCVAGVGL